MLSCFHVKRAGEGWRSSMHARVSLGFESSRCNWRHDVAGAKGAASCPGRRSQACVSFRPWMIAGLEIDCFCFFAVSCFLFAFGGRRSSWSRCIYIVVGFGPTHHTIRTPVPGGQGQELGRIGGLPVAKYLAIVLCRPVHVEGAHVTCPRCIRMHKNGADQI